MLLETTSTVVSRENVDTGIDRSLQVHCFVIVADDMIDLNFYQSDLDPVTKLTIKGYLIQ